MTLEKNHTKNEDENMNRCQYSIKYFDYDLKEPKLFHCSEDSDNSKFCVFHDEKFASPKKVVP